MRVWFAAFVLLFAMIELFDWMMQLDSWQPTGMWLVLGGMGLAVISNASYWSIGQPGLDNSKAGQADAQQKATVSEQTIAQIAETKSQKTKSQQMTDSLANQSDKESISFKVRPLKR